MIKDFDIQTRVDSRFKTWLKEIKLERASRKIDKDILSDRALTKEMMNKPSFKNLENEMLEKEIKSLWKIKLGAASDIFIVVIVGLIFLLFFAAWIFAHNALTVALINVPTVSDVNVSAAAEATIGQVNNALPVWYWAVGLIIVALFLSFLISNLFVKAHPVFFIAYILIVITSIIFAVIISNAYETTILTADIFEDQLPKFTIANFIFLNLPIWVTIFGFLGGMMLFIGLIRDEGAGGGLA